MTDIGINTTTTLPSLGGTVKWFSKDKGYGFITCAQDQDYYFSIKDVIGHTIPTPGSTVSFNPKPSQKGQRATSIRIQALSKNINSYPNCHSCNRKMIPRIVFSEGSPHHSICPFCAKTHKKFINPWKAMLSFILNIFFAGLGGGRR